MAEETKKTYTIRLPEQVAAQIEAQAAGRNVTPTNLLQTLIVQRFALAGDTAPLATLGGKLEAIRKACERLEHAATERYAQLLFEVVKSRSAIFHALDQNLSAPVVDEIIEASEKTAHEYVARLAGADEAKQ
jgi:hypothetical protein